jgi:hypothetical protein
MVGEYIVIIGVKGMIEQRDVVVMESPFQAIFVLIRLKVFMALLVIGELMPVFHPVLYI